MYQMPTFTNPYLDRLQAMQAPTMPQMPQMPQRYEITRVNGRNGAEAYQMPPNSAILLLDETAPIVWLKTTDGAGYPSLAPYSITPYQAAPEPDYKSLNERITRLEMMLNGKPNSASTGSPAYTGTAEQPVAVDATVPAVPATDVRA